MRRRRTAFSRTRGRAAPRKIWIAWRPVCRPTVSPRTPRRPSSSCARPAAPAPPRNRARRNDRRRVGNRRSQRARLGARRRHPRPASRLKSRDRLVYPRCPRTAPAAVATITAAAAAAAAAPPVTVAEAPVPWRQANRPLSRAMSFPSVTATSKTLSANVTGSAWLTIWASSPAWSRRSTSSI